MSNLFLALLSALNSVCLYLGITVALLRYRLYDADAAISRSAAYAVLTLALLGSFAGIEKVIELLGEEYLHEELGVLAGGLGAAAAAVMMVPLHHRLTHWADRRFRKPLVRLRHGLPLLVGDLRETEGIERIAAATLDAVTRGVHSRCAALLVDNAVMDARGIDKTEVGAWREHWKPPDREGFDIDRADKLFPLRVPLEAEGHGRAGWLLLGPRPDGSFYGKDEREALEEIADPVARALQIVAAREAREVAQEKRLTAVEAALAMIQERLAPPGKVRRPPRGAASAAVPG